SQVLEKERRISRHTDRITSRAEDNSFVFNDSISITHTKRLSVGFGPTSAFKSGPANGVGDERGGDTKGQPGALHSGQARVGVVLAKGLINGIDKGAHKGGRFAKNHRRLQAISALQAHRT